MLTFYYSAMGAGKSSRLIQMVHNYRKEMGLNVLVFNYAEDNRYEYEPHVVSRLGIKIPCFGFHKHTNFLHEYRYCELNTVAAVFVDECQFLTEKQCQELAYIVDQYNIPVYCFGLRTDFRGDTFEGSAKLLGIADRLIEIESFDKQGNPSRMQIRVDESGTRLTDGPQEQIGLNYIAISRKNFYATKS